MPTVDASEPASPAESRPPDPHAAGWHRLLWPGVCLFQFGLIVGLAVLWLRSSPPSSPVKTSDTKDESRALLLDAARTTRAARAPDALGSLDQADELIREGRYETALAVYQRLGGEGDAARKDLIQFRVALCLECLGKSEQALAEYSRLVGRSRLRGASEAGQLGQARIFVFRKQSAEAKQLLWDLLLRSSQPVLRDQPMLAEARYLLALALTLEAVKAETPAIIGESLATHAAVGRSLEAALNWIPPEKTGAEGTGPADQVAVKPTQGGPEEAVVRASIRQAAVADFIDRLAESSGLQVELSPKARQQLAGRTTAVAVQNMPLADLLYGLLDPHGLVWTTKDALLHISSEQETPNEVLAGYRDRLAGRALRNAVLLHPGHELTAAAYLELGNLEVVNGRQKEAIAWYQRLLRELPHSPASVEANFNLGLMHERLGDFEAARKVYYRVVDQAPGHELAGNAYLQIGRLYLAEDDAEQALRPLRRAQASATVAPVRATAAITLAVAQLLTRNPRAANLILRQARTQVSQEPFLQMATFVDSYARYRALSDRRPGREASELLASLLLVREDPVLGSLGIFLRGQAFRELGMSEQMAVLYEKALPQTQGPLARKMSMVLAEYYLAANDRERARPLLTSLALGLATKETAQAQLRLAEISLQEKHPDDCLKNCRRLLQTPNEVDVPAILKLMGRAFEQRGDHRQAARCFAGRIPEPVPGQ